MEAPGSPSSRRTSCLRPPPLGGAGLLPGEINLALKGIDLDALTLEEVIKQALKKMMKG